MLDAPSCQSGAFLFMFAQTANSCWLRACGVKAHDFVSTDGFLLQNEGKEEEV